MVQKRVCTSSDAMVDYQERHLSNGEYHLEEGKIEGQFIGGLAEDWNLTNEAILKRDPRFRWFAALDVEKLRDQPLKSERQAMEFVYSAPKSVSIAAVLDGRIGEQMTMAVNEELKWY